MDTELFELCNEVFQRTGWRDGSLTFISGHPYTPIYTSDYLLPKLSTRYLSLENSATHGNALWVALWGMSVRTSADTPLKALLKLVLALKKAGELKPTERLSNNGQYNF
jgi:hypothetical protein